MVILGSTKSHIGDTQMEMKYIGGHRKLNSNWYLAPQNSARLEPGQLPMPALVQEQCFGYVPWQHITCHSDLRVPFPTVGHPDKCPRKCCCRTWPEVAPCKS